MKTPVAFTLRRHAIHTLLAALLVASLFTTRRSAAQSAPARNVVLVMTDGLRWQELFRGADESLLTPVNYYDNRSVDDLKKEFLAPTAEKRRALLMPFTWKTLAKNGQLFGDRDTGSDASVTNGFNFSYPGYSETLTGHGDPRISSNDNIPNPNVTVLEWLNKQPGLGPVHTTEAAATRADFFECKERGANCNGLLERRKHFRSWSCTGLRRPVWLFNKEKPRRENLRCTQCERKCLSDAAIGKIGRVPPGCG